MWWSFELMFITHTVAVNGTSEWHQQLLEDSKYSNQQMHTSPLMQAEKAGSKIKNWSFMYWQLRLISWPRHLVTGVQFQASPSGICGGQNASRAGFSPSTSIFPHNFIAPLLHTYIFTNHERFLASVSVVTEHTTKKENTWFPPFLPLLQ